MPSGKTKTDEQGMADALQSESTAATWMVEQLSKSKVTPTVRPKVKKSTTKKPVVEKAPNKVPKPWERVRIKALATWMRRTATAILNDDPDLPFPHNRLADVAETRRALRRWFSTSAERGQEKEGEDGRKQVSQNGMNVLLTSSAGSSWSKYESGASPRPSVETLNAMERLIPGALDFWQCGPEGFPAWVMLAGDGSAAGIGFSALQSCRWNVRWVAGTLHMLERDVEVFNRNATTRNGDYCWVAPRPLNAINPNKDFPGFLAEVWKLSAEGLWMSVDEGFSRSEHDLMVAMFIDENVPRSAHSVPSFTFSAGQIMAAAVSTLIQCGERGSLYRWNDFHADDEIFHRFWDMRGVLLKYGERYGFADAMEACVINIARGYLLRNRYKEVPDIETIRALKNESGHYEASGPVWSRDGQFVMAWQASDAPRKP